MSADGVVIAGKLGITAGAISLAVLCWMSASDRLTAQSESPEHAYFGAEAAAQIAFAQLAENNPQRALVEARRAVQTAPIDPSTTSALGSTLLTLGKADQAYAAFAVAGALGWREVPTQLYWLAQAEAAGDVGVAAQRLDALLRLDIDNEAVANSFYTLGQTQLGQQALANLLLNKPPWERRFLLETGGLEGADLEGRLAAIELAASQGASFDCEAIGIAANRLIRNDMAATAKQLWRRACERSEGALLSNGAFETDPSITSRSPFTWQLQSEGGLDVAVQPAPPPLKGHALRIRSSMTARTIAAHQLTALQPGRYRLSWTTALDNGTPDDGIKVLVRCEGAGELTAAYSETDATQGNRVETTFAVPQQDCPIQTVAVQKAASGFGNTQTGWIDDIRIVPIGAEGAAR